MISTDVWHIVKNNKIYIYGAGYVAKQFLSVLQKEKMDEQVRGFILTNKNGNTDERILDIPIYSIYEIDKDIDEFVIIAVHESLRQEIEDVIMNRGIKKYLWVTPYVKDMMLGVPIEKDKMVAVNDVVQHINDYNIAVKYLAIEQYYEKNNVGYELYKKHLRLFSSEDTVNNRFEHFKSLIKDWEEKGYNSSKVCISEDYMVLDGNHRTALAIWHQVEHINCDVYKKQNALECYGENAIFTKKVLYNTVFNTEDIKYIEECNKKIKDKYMKNKMY